jgi:hypothetical protein
VPCGVRRNVVGATRHYTHWCFQMSSTDHVSNPTHVGRKLQRSPVLSPHDRRRAEHEPVATPQNQQPPALQADRWFGLYARAPDATFDARSAHAFPRPSDSVVAHVPAIASNLSITAAFPGASSSRKRRSWRPAGSRLSIQAATRPRAARVSRSCQRTSLRGRDWNRRSCWTSSI